MPQNAVESVPHNRSISSPTRKLKVEFGYFAGRDNMQEVFDYLDDLEEQQRQFRLVAPPRHEAG